MRNAGYLKDNKAGGKGSTHRFTFYPEDSNQFYKQKNL